MFGSTFKNAIYDTWPILAIFLVTIVGVRIAYLLNHHEKFSLYKEIINIMAILYILLLFQLVTNTELNHNGGFNIVPFSEIMRYSFGSKLFIFNVLGNIIVFIPFGFFVASYIKPKKGFSTFLVCLLTSTTIEFVQLKIGRSFDVDDILLNVIGGIIGYLIYKLFQYIGKKVPKLSEKDGLFNIICIIIVIVLVIYILKVLGA